MSGNTPASSLIPGVRAAVAETDPDLPIEDLMTMEQAFARWSAPARFVAALMSALSGVALLLACIGVYGSRLARPRGRSRCSSLARVLE